MTDKQKDVMKHAWRTYDTRIKFVWLVAFTAVQVIIYFFRPTSLNCEAYLWVCECVCVCVCVCIYIYIHTHTHTHSHLTAYSMCVCVYIYRYVYTHNCAILYVYIYIYIYICTHICVRCMCVCIYIYIYIHTHTVYQYRCYQIIPPLKCFCISGTARIVDRMFTIEAQSWWWWLCEFVTLDRTLYCWPKCPDEIRTSEHPHPHPSTRAVALSL